MTGEEAYWAGLTSEDDDRAGDGSCGSCEERLTNAPDHGHADDCPFNPLTRKAVPPVPAQEAPREPKVPKCSLCHDVFRPCICVPYEAEPQAGAQTEITGPCEFHSENAWGVCRVCAQRKAGAQVPSPVVVFESKDAAVLHMRGLLELAEKTIEAQATHLNSIAAYATEAAKTPITREDMHDPLLAQTFYDEAKGFERLVLSEIGEQK